MELDSDHPDSLTSAPDVPPGLRFDRSRGALSSGTGVCPSPLRRVLLPRAVEAAAGGGQIPGKVPRVNSDARIAVTFQHHAKTRRLRRRCGAEGPECLMYLWAWAAANRPRGAFTNMSASDIAEVAGWAGDPQEFVDALLDPGPGAGPDQRGFLEHCTQDGSTWYTLHDWRDHNEYAYHAVERSAAARDRARKRWDSDARRNAAGNAASMDAPRNAAGTNNAPGNAGGNAGSNAAGNARACNAPSPVPAPVPAPSPDPFRRNAQGIAGSIDGAHAPAPDNGDGEGQRPRLDGLDFTPRHGCPKCHGSGKITIAGDTFACFRCRGEAGAESASLGALETGRSYAAAASTQPSLTPLEDLLHVEPAPAPPEDPTPCDDDNVPF